MLKLRQLLSYHILFVLQLQHSIVFSSFAEAKPLITKTWMLYQYYYYLWRFYLITIMKRLFVLCSLCLAVAAFGQQGNIASKYASVITPEALKEKLSVIAGA